MMTPWLDERDTPRSPLVRGDMRWLRDSFVKMIYDPDRWPPHPANWWWVQCEDGTSHMYWRGKGPDPRVK